VTTRARYFGASSSLLRLVRPELAEVEVCCMTGNHWSAEQKSEGWKKNVQNYGKWRGAVAKYGGVSLGKDDNKDTSDGTLYGGIMARARTALEHFHYVRPPSEGPHSSSGSSGSSGGVIGEYNYSASTGGLALDCGGFEFQACPAVDAHKQKCM
jgi:hypothetical protein